ncbi:MAG TPA: aminopeptidase N, partial [Streptosporangiaceae bacterium]|nr:aminopeptidase N [Streptosporangiaceae bacterium]
MGPASEAPASALTYAEAQERSRLIDLRGYRIDLDLSGGQDTFGSVTEVRFGCREPGSASFVEVRPTRLRRAMLNGRELDPGTLHGNRLPLPGLRDVNELRVEADMAYSRDGAGLHRYTDAADGETYLALHAGLDNAQRVFAAFDQPDLKAAITATVVAPGSWTVLGNGTARPAEPAGPPGCLRWDLAVTPPISSYLFTLLAGPYYSISSEHRGIPFGLHSRRSLAEALDRDAAEILAITRACFDRYLEIFTEPYPFDSYDQAFVPELEAGAVENPGCITFRDEFLFPAAVTHAERQTRGMVIAHEMAHMWFGDLVTMAWWNDVWLSESFATYMGFQVLSEATAFTGAWTDFALSHKPRGYDADQRASTHPVAPGPPEVPDTDAARSAYDDISYAKGASALRQLVAWTGWPAFIAGINDYLARYRFASANLDDLLDCLARSSGADLRDWAARWLRTPGVDTLTVQRDGAGSLAHTGSRAHQVWLGVYDQAPADARELVLRARIPVRIGADAGQLTLPPAAADPPPALLLPNDGDLSYCKLRFDPGSRAALISGLGRLPDPLSRAVAWNTVRDLVRDAELPAQDYLELAARHLLTETETEIAGPVLGFARWTIADRYLDRPRREAALTGLSGLCQALLRRAAGPDASGMRLVAARGLIDSASRPDEVAELRSWFEAGGLPGGPDLDSRLRWQIMLRLAVLGAVAQRAIEAEAGRDTTAAGQQAAARCRAALPGPDAKQAAWAEMLGPDPSRYLLAGTAEGFWQADQTDLLAGYVPRYFTALGDLAARGDPATARVLVRHGFPQHAVASATLRAGADCLAG